MNPQGLSKGDNKQSLLPLTFQWLSFMLYRELVDLYQVCSHYAHGAKNVTLYQSCYARFFFRKKGIIFVTKSVHRPSITFLVNVSLPKQLNIATSNFIAE